MVEAVICPFGFNYARQVLGNITTKHYYYYVSQGNKFSKLDVAHYDETCLRLEDRKLPVELLNTNEAYQLPTEWLRRVSMDVDALNRECKCRVAVSALWNRLQKLGDRPHKRFVPIYLYVGFAEK